MIHLFMNCNLQAVMYSFDLLKQPSSWESFVREIILIVLNVWIHYESFIRKLDCAFYF